jgi:uncharacterized protein YndB with AHSA1/START domain
VTRTFNAPARIVFEAWTRPELLKRWWAPKSSGAALLPALLQRFPFIWDRQVIPYERKTP